MTVKELRTLIDNLDEYIHVPGGIERLKKTVLHLAVSGQLVSQDPSEGTGEELYQQIIIKNIKLFEQGKIKKQKSLIGVTVDELPFEIPNNWTWAKLGDVADYKKGPFGSALTKAMFVPKSENSVKVYEQKNAIRKDAGLGEYYIPHEYYKTKMSGFSTGPSDIIVSCAGTIGEMYVLPEEAASGIINQALMRVRLDSLINTDYYLICLDKAITTNLDKAMGTAMKNIPPFAVLKNIPVPLPPRQEQDRIIEKVNTVFGLIDNLAAKYKAEQAERKKLVTVALAGLARGDSELAFTHLTEIIRTKADAAELRKTILHLAVSGQLVPQDPSEGTGEELYQQIQAEKTKLVRDGMLKAQKALPPIKESEVPFQSPQNWTLVRLGGLCWLEQGEKVKDEKLNNLDAKYLRGMKDPEIKQSGFVINSSERMILVDGENSGEVFIAPERGYLGSTFKKLGITPRLEIGYLDIILRALKQEMRENKIGSAIPHLDKKLFREKTVGLPPLAEQTRIVQKTTQLLDLVTQLEQRLEK